MSKCIAICCSGQLREGRFYADNHHNFMIKHFISLGYTVSYYFYTDKFITQRSIQNNNDIYWTYQMEDVNKINYYFNKVSDGLINKKLIIEDSQSNIINNEEKTTNGYSLQFKKITASLKMAQCDKINYDIIIRYRPDVYFTDKLPLPTENEVIQSNYPCINYQSDVIQIFPGKFLNKIINLFEEYDNNPIKNPEGFINNCFQQIGVQLTLKNYIANYWRNKFNWYFKYINWNFYDDRISIESPPYKIEEIKQICDQHKSLEITEIDMTNWKFTSEPIKFQEIILSAYQPDNIINYKEHILESFIGEISNQIVGLIPLAGNATRMYNLPKFLLPCPGNEKTLLDHCLKKFQDSNITNIYGGVSNSNKTILKDKQGIKLLETNTKTMTETVKKLVDKISIAKSYILIMPDTFFLVTDEIEKIKLQLDHYPLVVALWKIREQQKGKLGQCLIKNNLVLDVVDKNIDCNYEYIWGMLAWRRELNQYIDENEQTIGSLITYCIKHGINVGYVLMSSTYFDCGTPNEYFEMINHNYV